MKGGLGMSAECRLCAGGCDSQGSLAKRQSEVDKRAILVHFGANGCMMGKSDTKRRFSISLEVDDYEALRALAEGHRPPLSLQYVVNVAVKDLLEKHASRQLTLPLDK